MNIFNLIKVFICKWLYYIYHSPGRARVLSLSPTHTQSFIKTRAQRKIQNCAILSLVLFNLNKLVPEWNHWYYLSWTQLFLLLEYCCYIFFLGSLSGWSVYCLWYLVDCTDKWVSSHFKLADFVWMPNNVELLFFS